MSVSLDPSTNRRFCALPVANTNSVLLNNPQAPPNPFGTEEFSDLGDDVSNVGFVLIP